MFSSSAREIPDLQARIDACAARGGGRVTVPAGEWEVRPFALKSHVTLELAEGAVLCASTNVADYPMPPGEKCFVRAEDATDVAICGSGVLDGRGACFRERSGLAGESQPQHLPVLMRFTRCRNVRLSDFTYRRSAAWGCHLRNCDGVEIRRVKCFNHVNATNDGIDIESANVLIEDCEIDSDDDAIVFKTESDRSFAVTNVLVRNCRLASCCNAVKFGTGSYGDFRDIEIRDCRLRRAAANFRFSWWKSIPGVTNRITGIAGLALEVVDGGRLERVTVRDIEMEGYQTPIFVRHHRRHAPLPGQETYLRDVLVERVRGFAESRIASSVTGIPGLRPRNIVLRDIDLTYPGGAAPEEVAHPVPEKETAYPEAFMFDRHPLPAFGFYIRHADGVVLDNVRVRTVLPDARPAIVRDDAPERTAESWLPVPDRVISGYSGFFLGADPSHVDRMIDQLADHGFNSIDIKIQTTDRKKFDLEGHKAEVKRLVDHARARGLAFNVYLYPFPSRPGKSAQPLDDPQMWLRIFPHAIQFARLRKELGFASLRFDIETVHLYEAVDAAKMDRIAAAVKGFADALRAVDPDLILGYMPADHHPLSEAFDRSLATDRLPAMLDAWDLYNGGGYTDKVRTRAEHVKKVHPNNRFVAWLRPNSYRPGDIAVSAYHAAKNTDGYSMWTLLMLDEVTRKSRLNGTYDIPKGTVAEDYLREYRRANDALAGKGPEIPWRKIAPVVPPLDLGKIAFPSVDLIPHDPKASGSLMLRDPQTLFVHLKKGETVEMSVRHEAGSRRPVAVHYAVLAPDRSVLRDENVSPGGEERFSIAAAADGVYALTCSGGSSGQAWYRVTVKGAAAGVDARGKGGAYLFGPQRFQVFGSDRGNAKMLVGNSSVQAYRWRMNGGAWHDAVGQSKNEIELPAGPVTFEIAGHATLYCQDFFITFPDGREPFVFTK